MAELPKDPLYNEADPRMLFRVFKPGLKPGMVALETLAVPRLSSEAVLSNRIDQEVAARQTAITTEVAARTYADMQEGQARAAADTAEASARAAADTALGNRITALEGKIVPFAATLVLPGGLSLLVGKSTRTVAIVGLKKSDNVVVTPNAALPANISMGEAYCLADGVLTVVILNTALLALNLSTTQNIPLGVLALRP